MSSSLLWGVHYVLENINNPRNQQKKKLEMKITGTPARTCEGSQSGSGTRRTPCLTRSSQGPHGRRHSCSLKHRFANRLQRPPSCKQHRRTQSMTLPSQPTGSRQHPLSSSRACTVNKHTRTHICMHTHAHTFYKANTLDVRTLDETWARHARL